MLLPRGCLLDSIGTSKHALDGAEALVRIVCGEMCTGTVIAANDLDASHSQATPVLLTTPNKYYLIFDPQKHCLTSFKAPVLHISMPLVDFYSFTQD